MEQPPNSKVAFPPTPGEANWWDQYHCLTPLLNTCSWDIFVASVGFTIAVVCNDGGSVVTRFVWVSSFPTRHLVVYELRQQARSNLCFKGACSVTNVICGSVPREIGWIATSDLADLQLDRNRLKGSVPSKLENLSSLNGRFLHKNKLSEPSDATLASYCCYDPLSGAV